MAQAQKGLSHFKKEEMMKEKMKKAFQTLNGGLFEKNDKADVGNSYTELAKDGVDLMGWADPFTPDFCIPKHVLDKAIEVLNDPIGAHYTSPCGNPDLKRAIAHKLKMKNGLEVDPERNILITPGSDAGLFYAIFPFLEAGDEVIIPSPSYPNNYTDVTLTDAIVIPLLLKEEDGYQIDREELESKVTSKTKMIILTHPNNPTTTVYDMSSLKAIADVCIERDLILVCDQAFEDFTFENEMITPASLPGMFERTITVFSISKGMGLSGFRVGYNVCSDVFMDAMLAAAVSVIGASSTMAQIAAIEAFKDDRFMDEFKEAYDRRRHKAYEIINSIPNVHMLLPESGFLAWVDVSVLGSSKDIYRYLIKEAKVATNEGSFYGPGGEGHLRIVLGVYRDDEKVYAALYRIKDALMRYGKERP